MTAKGAALPFVTEADPEEFGESASDPLGLAPVAEAIAGTIVPGITNRMRHPRWLTAIAFGAVLADGLEPVSGVGPEVVFEWMLLEGFAKDGRFGPGQSTESVQWTVPGSAKATAAVKSGRRLSTSSYLKNAASTGFTGIMLPLAVEMGVMHKDRSPGEAADDLVDSWIATVTPAGVERGPSGELKGRSFGYLRRTLEESLAAGQSTLKLTPKWTGLLTDTLLPVRPKAAERMWLVERLGGPAAEGRHELAKALKALGSVHPKDEELLVHNLHGVVKGDLRRKVALVKVFEPMARRYDAVFEAWLVAATSAPSHRVTAKKVGVDATVKSAFKGLQALGGRVQRSAADADLGVVEAEDLVALTGASSPTDLARQVFDLHVQAQARRGNASWFEGDADDAVLRLPYLLDSVPKAGFDGYRRPYRLLTFDAMLRSV